MNTVHTNENLMSESVALLVEQAATPSVDMLCAKAAEFVLTPDDTFKRKLNLIEKASDMSTSQKIEAINQAEEKHIADKIAYTVITVVLIAAATPEGRKAIGSVAKSVATAVAPLYKKVAGQVACYFAISPTRPLV